MSATDGLEAEANGSSQNVADRPLSGRMESGAAADPPAEGVGRMHPRLVGRHEGDRVLRRWEISTNPRRRPCGGL
jgi:hypothetical protein